MVKAGVYIILRVAPALENTVAAKMLMLVGGVTFLVTALIAISQSNAKKVLAYSTISNLGLIVACAGVNTECGSVVSAAADYLSCSGQIAIVSVRGDYRIQAGQP